MWRLLICLLFLISSNFLFSQSQQFIIRTQKTGLACDSLFKEIEIRNLNAGKDSVILRSSFFECEFRFSIDSPDSLFSVKITVEDGTSGQMNLNLGQLRDSIIDLGQIELKRSTKQLDEFTVTGIKKSFIRIEADKKIVTVKDNPVLSVSSVYDAILKIPGVVPFPGGGFVVNGKQASIYFENVPSAIGGDNLWNLLRSMPATSVETIEIISNPGAAYDANLSGAIINIITMAKVSGYISGTVTMNYGLNEINKVMPSFSLSGKTKKLSWQFYTGYSYYESLVKSRSSRVFTALDPEVNIFNNRSNLNKTQWYQFMPSLNYRLNKKSSLILNYAISKSANSSSGTSETGFAGLEPSVFANVNTSSKNSGLNQNATLIYRLNLDTLRRVFSTTVNFAESGIENLGKTAQFQDAGSTYSLINTNLRVKRVYMRSDLELPFDSLKFYVNTGIKAAGTFVSNDGRYNLQNPSSAIFDNPEYNNNIDFDYEESNLAAYIDLKKGFGKKFTLGAGLRAESFTLNRRSNLNSNIRSNYTNLFPSANAIYRLFPDVNLIATYARKISIPGYSQFDPNNTGYYDSYTSSVGNAFLLPNFSDDYEAKITVFDYLEVSMNYSLSSRENLTLVNVVPNSISTVSTFKTYNNVSVLSHFFALPVPLSFFRKGMKFFDEPLDIDNLNYVYMYAVRNKTNISGLELPFKNRAMWYYGLNSQFILPWKFKLHVSAWLSDKGTYQLYDMTKQQSGVEAILSRDFYNKKLRASVTVTDIFNKNETNSRTSFTDLYMATYSKTDTRVLWMKLSWSFGKFEKPAASGFNMERGGPPVSQ